MKKMRISDWAVLSLLSLVACGEQLPVTGSSRDVVTTPVAPANLVLQETVCSNAVTAAASSPVWFSVPKNGAWALPVAGSGWVGQTATSDADYLRSSSRTFTAGFTVPAGATGITVSGLVMADNDVDVSITGNPKFFQSYVGASPIPGYPAGSSSSTYQNFGIGGGGVGLGLPFGPVAASVGLNTVTFVVYNDDVPNPGQPGYTTGNPSGLSFCFTVSYTEFVPPTAVALFVIGDVEAHGIGANVNFWGAQWWKNNFMSGTVSNGVAAFKGYATSSTNVCGGTWVSLPGNSSNPPATIPAVVRIIVTSKVIKSGNNISGDIVQIVNVTHDGNYADNPGHAGSGPVTSVACP